VQMTCSRVVIINEGQVVAQDSIEHLTAGLGRFQTVRLRVARDQDDLAARLAAVPGVAEARREAPATYLARLQGGDEARERVAAAVVAAGAGLLELARERASLEEIFLKLVTDEKGEEAA